MVYPKKIITMYLVHIYMMSCYENFMPDFHAFCKFTDLQS